MAKEKGNRIAASGIQYKQPRGSPRRRGLIQCYSAGTNLPVGPRKHLAGHRNADPARDGINNLSSSIVRLPSLIVARAGEQPSKRDLILRDGDGRSAHAAARLPSPPIRVFFFFSFFFAYSPSGDRITTNTCEHRSNSQKTSDIDKLSRFLYVQHRIPQRVGDSDKEHPEDRYLST